MARLVDPFSTCLYLVLDFDGTLVDSNPIKLRAFDICFEDYPEKMEDIRAYCYKHHHSTRDEKFQYVFQIILKKPYTAEIEKKMMDRYAAVTTQAVVKAPEIPGALSFLKKMMPRMPMVVLSSTPQPYISEIIRKRGWSKFFQEVKGAPIQKEKWLKNFIEDKKCKPKDVLFLGDSLEDAKCGEEAGCTFVGVSNEELAGKGTLFIHDFQEIGEEIP